MIRKALQNGDLESAHQKLNEFFTGMENIRNELLSQTARIKRLQKEDAMEVISYEQKVLEENKISLATLFCCHEIEEQLVQYFPTVKFKVTSESLSDQLMVKLRDQYEELMEMNRGGSAVFFKGRETYTGRQVVIRVYRDLNLEQQDAGKINDPRLERALNLKHRNVIKVLGSDLKNYPKHLVLEYIDGISLDHLIGEVPFTLYRAYRIICQISQALYHLHINGIIHGNIKPDKVLIDNELEPVISPFEIVSSTQSGSANSASSQNLLYSAPELLKGKLEKPDYKSDQFGIGLLAYELIAGTPLFCNCYRGESEHNIQTVFENRLRFFQLKTHRKALLSDLQVPKKLEQIIGKLLSENPEDRYDSMKEVLEDLNDVKIPVEEALETAMASYERCCIANPHFTADFYKKLFESTLHKEEILPFFQINETAKDRTRREKMLRIAIELLIRGEKEKEKLREILKIDAHKKVAPHLYQVFINTILETVAENDYLWQRLSEAGRPNPIEYAWEAVKQKGMEILFPNPAAEK